MGKPAILGGRPAFGRKVPLARPNSPEYSVVEKGFRNIIKSGKLTLGRYTGEFEKKVRLKLGVKGAVLASSCTSGLYMLQDVLGISGKVVIPSFTFFATAHTAVLRGSSPLFCDCDPFTFNIDLNHAEKLLKKNRAVSAIIAVHVFGAPAPVDGLAALARKYKVKVIYDAAHGLGARYRGAYLGGNGNGEVFSISPTKIITGGEGGIITVNDCTVSDALRAARNYGDEGTYNPGRISLNGRLPEFSALFALKALPSLDRLVSERNRLARLYIKHLSPFAGLSFQKIPAACLSTYKDFALLIDEKKAGLSRDALCAALAAENIDTRRYFYPPLHRQRHLKRFAAGGLVNTDKVSDCILCLPLYNSMKDEQIIKICRAVERILDDPAEVAKKCRT